MSRPVAPWLAVVAALAWALIGVGVTLGSRAVVVTLFFAAATMATTFVVLFGVGTRLRPATPAGRQILTFAAAAAYLLDLGVYSITTGTRAPVWVSIPGYAGLNIALAWQIWLLLRTRPQRTEEYTMTEWLRADARNRAWRTILQGLLAVVILPACDAVLQVVMKVIVAGEPIDWRRTAALAAASAMTAAVMSIAAYLHRLKVDPSSIPSAQPPRPPGTPVGAAPATDPPPTGR